MQKKENCFEEIKNNETVKGLIEATKENLDFRGFNAHGFDHANFVAEEVKRILLSLGYSEKMAELTSIAGYLHDIGNCINREQHASIGATLAFEFLTDLNLPVGDVIQIVSTIGNHDENSDGLPINEYCAALIVADKCDVHHSRVNRKKPQSDNIHYRVNDAVEHREIIIDKIKKIIILKLVMNSSSSLFELMEIYSGRFRLCERSAAMLGCKFKIIVNEIDITGVTGGR